MNYPALDILSEASFAMPSSLDFSEMMSATLWHKFNPSSVPVSDKPSTVIRQIPRGKSTSERLFDATAEAKRWTSQVAMRLNAEARLRIFRQLDRLHDEEEWFEGDHPVALESYKAFVRAYVSGSIGGKPALALAHDGRLIAMWQNSGDKLTIEFFPRDKVRYLVSQVVSGERERFAGDTSVSRLSHILNPFDTGRWFNGG